MAGDLIVIGRIARPHGIRGEVRVQSFTETPDSWEPFEQVYVRLPERRARLVEVIAARPHKSSILIKFKDIHSRDDAEALIGADVLVRREWLPGLEKDEYYWTDLIGLCVYDSEGRPLGRVADLMNAGSDDILIIKDGEREILLPFRDETILEVDVPNGRVDARPPVGLLELY